MSACVVVSVLCNSWVTWIGQSEAPVFRLKIPEDAYQTWPGAWHVPGMPLLLPSISSQSALAFDNTMLVSLTLPFEVPLIVFISPLSHTLRCTLLENQHEDARA